MFGLFIILCNILLLKNGEQHCSTCVVASGLWIALGAFMLGYYLCSLAFMVYCNYQEMRKTH